MPFKSKAQQRFMFATDPKMAKKWAEHTPDMKDLPDKKEAADRPEVDMAQILGYTVPHDAEIEENEFEKERRKMPKLRDTYKIREDVKVGKLHEPEDFAEEVKSFASEVHAQLNMIEHFAQEHQLKAVLDYVKKARDDFGGIEHEVNNFAGELQKKAELEAKQAAASVTSSTTAFKKA